MTAATGDRPVTDPMPTLISMETEQSTADGVASVSSPVSEPARASSGADSPTLTWRQELKIFASTFVTILVAEVGDKTQLTTLLMSAESQSPWIVFLGAGSALVATSLLGVLVGRWLATRVSPRALETAVGGLLLLISVLLLWDVVHL
jgi:putative Ca2+/H+ antiporter (TMEM165/GDT1 family)